MYHHLIANAMCKVTDQILRQPRKDWAMKRCPGNELELRVGAGKKQH
jgi:hypothetical protein